MMLGTRKDKKTFDLSQVASDLAAAIGSHELGERLMSKAEEQVAGVRAESERVSENTARVHSVPAHVTRIIQPQRHPLSRCYSIYLCR